MRRLAALLLATAVCVGAALAQPADQAAPPAQEATATPFDPISMPREYYPTRPLERNVSGSAALCCRISEDMSLDCVAESETPEAQQFADQALRLAARIAASEGIANYARTSASPMRMNFEFRSMTRGRIRTGEITLSSGGFCTSPTS